MIRAMAGSFPPPTSLASRRGRWIEHARWPHDRRVLGMGSEVSAAEAEMLAKLEPSFR